MGFEIFVLFNNLFMGWLKTSAAFVFHLHSQTGRRRFAVESHLNVARFVLMVTQMPLEECVGCCKFYFIQCDKND